MGRKHLQLFLLLLITLTYSRNSCGIGSSGISGENSKKAGMMNSVLSYGTWYKIGVTLNGIYRIDYDFLKKAGINPEDIDPAMIRLFGNGGEKLPQKNSDPRPQDLIENSILIVGQNDGRFDKEDYILFYGQSPHTMHMRNDGDTIVPVYSHNPYSDTTFYFLNVGDETGMRISDLPDEGSNFPHVTTFDVLNVYETDNLNLLAQNGGGSGREWYGEKFEVKTSYDFDFQIGKLIPDMEFSFYSKVIASSFSSTHFEISVNGFPVGTQEMQPIPDATFGSKGSENFEVFKINSSDLNPEQPQMLINYKYDKGGDSGSAGYLDYFYFWYKTDLSDRPESCIFSSVASLNNSTSTFEISGKEEGDIIWNITDPLHPLLQEFTAQNGNILFGTESDQLHEYILFNMQETKNPDFKGTVPNQDLHGMNAPEMLIVTYPAVMPAAVRLANFRNMNGISTSVVTTTQIYNEFSSGAQDVTAIRDFVKYLYDQREGLKYLLLFGKGSYDYKDRVQNNSDYVPIYESRNSLHPIYSYSSDDYFGFMDDNEGEWPESSSGDHTMEIGIGRLPVKSRSEADIITDKIIIYETDPRCYGAWRNDIYFVADDGDGIDGIQHEKDADRLAEMVDTLSTDFNITKIYTDAYPQIIEPDRQLAPEVNKSINNAVKRGALLMNYTGHGSEIQWASENILNVSAINQWENLFRLPLLVTATCEFGRHDNPKVRSGAEYALINDRGGAIGLVTTSRPVYSSTNFSLNQAFYKEVFKKVDGVYQTIGEIFRKTKNEALAGPVNRNFSLLGDPSMRLAYPEKNMIITKINERPVSEMADTLAALKKVTVYGNVLDNNGELLDNFDGIARVSVYDKPVIKRTLGTQDPVMSYKERNNFIFRGNASIKNGNFQFTFVVPKNISYSLGDGRISLYATNGDNTIDAAGSNMEIKVGGSLENAPHDDTPPGIVLYMEDSTFNPVIVTSDHPRLKADIYDESGINLIENGISRGIVAVLDGEEEFVLNDFYTANLDDYQHGSVDYPLTGLTAGHHKIVLKVWDVYNNPAKDSIEFQVGDPNILYISNLTNYPNPFKNETTFSFEHNHAGEDLEITIDIYSISGELVREIMGISKNSNFRINDISWDGRRADGKKLDSGIYIYRLFVRSLLDGAKNRFSKKLIIIN